MRLDLLLALSLLVGCGNNAVETLATPPPPQSPSPAIKTIPGASVDAGKAPPKVLLTAPELSGKGLALIYEFEVGGKRQYERNPHPELPDLRFSGVTAGIGYDLHQYSKRVIIHDWSEVLDDTSTERLAETQPFYGKTAVEPLKKVKDITISWGGATHVFLANDAAREFAAAKRAFPKFEELTQNCQAALIANGFARGWNTAGPSRTELRDIKSLIPKKDYSGIAGKLRAQERVWRGTSVYNGLRARVNAEAKLAETP